MAHAPEAGRRGNVAAALRPTTATRASTWVSLSQCVRSSPSSARFTTGCSAQRVPAQHSRRLLAGGGPQALARHHEGDASEIEADRANLRVSPPAAAGKSPSPSFQRVYLAQFCSAARAIPIRNTRHHCRLNNEPDRHRYNAVRRRNHCRVFDTARTVSVSREPPRAPTWEIPSADALDCLCKNLIYTLNCLSSPTFTPQTNTGESRNIYRSILARSSGNARSLFGIGAHIRPD
jgi:hypothetical protein